MARSKKSEQKIPLTQADLERFHANAAAALARRGGAYMWEEVTGGLQTVLAGAVPLVGLGWWGWSAVEMMVFLLVGAWVGILCDAAKVLLLRERAEAFAATMYDDWHVWVVVDALRNGSHAAHPSHLRAKWDPLGGVFVDFAMGGISTLLIVMTLIHEAGLDLATLESPGLLACLLGYALLRVADTVWEILHHRAADRNRQPRGEHATVRPDSDRPVRAVVGLRGVGLFLLVFLVVILTDEKTDLHGDVTWMCMAVLNALVIVVGGLNFTGPIWLGPETRWLRRYLADRAA
ncbi:hypothetical protein Pla123a_18600 [Posidoniimonas polymericola]|uniref:Uncharacterized protein n=1 Tax=Posidoniimonas polymericola TaxID=2528002 RepID=A0A5C5YQL5_9BACT|nr:hypothetical protein [Posidoniimonas polymericola]TWT77205.1 hypothetical protein Pla123a_18600 [Posidoniimonas polymericola]